MPSTFEAETQVRPAGEEVYETELGDSWRAWQGPNGGYLAAILQRATRDRFPDAGPLRALSVAFLEPAEAGPAEVAVEPLREGGSVTVARARLVQDGRPVVDAEATLGAAGKGPRFVAEDPPEVPGWEEALPMPEDTELEPPEFTQHCEFRLAGGSPPLAGEPGGEMRVWMRPAEPAPLDEPLVAFLADAWMPALMAAVETPLPAPSLTMDLQLGDVPEDHADGEPLLGVFRTEHAADGYAAEDGTLWTPDGRLVARARQTRRVLTPR